MPSCGAETLDVEASSPRPGAAPPARRAAAVVGFEALIDSRARAPGWLRQRLVAPEGEAREGAVGEHTRVAPPAPHDPSAWPRWEASQPPGRPTLLPLLRASVAVGPAYGQRVRPHGGRSAPPMHFLPRPSRLQERSGCPGPTSPCVEFLPGMERRAARPSKHAP
jgi:hypothetical protein